jgi:hypothetical protein
MKKHQQGSTMILCDDKLTIAMMKNHVFHNKTNTYQSNIIFYEKQLATKKLSSSIAKLKNN